jgi:glucuronoarabinoxylan endo-1,4-beta-xylanase
MTTVKISTSLLAFSLLFIACSKNKELAEANVNTTKGTAAIDGATIQQTIQGFGGASIPIWIGDLTSDQRTKAFSTTSGIGMSILRVMVPTTSSQFAAEKPTIDAAKGFGAKVIATAWNAPASMMDGLKLKTSSYAAYAAHLSSYNTAVGGVYAISPWNEPNYSASGWMGATATEVASFVAAQGDNCGAPVMAPEPFNMDASFINTYLSNATAKSKTSFLCGHIYGATPTYLGSLGKSMWMTEHYTNSSISGNDWGNAMTAAKEIHDCMVAGWAAYVWWYIRRFYGPIDESSNITKLGYVMAQFARYVRPGYSKIACTANPTAGVYTTAYKSGTKVVIVIVNQNNATTYQPFTLSGVSVTGFNRYYTTSSANLASNSFAVSGGSFGINLAPSSVTTLVSQ